MQLGVPLVFRVIAIFVLLWSLLLFREVAAVFAAAHDDDDDDDDDDVNGDDDDHDHGLGAAQALFRRTCLLLVLRFVTRLVKRRPRC
jgi:hypothetical protein